MSPFLAAGVSLCVFRNGIFVQQEKTGSKTPHWPESPESVVSLQENDKNDRRFDHLERPNFKPFYELQTTSLLTLILLYKKAGILSQTFVRWCVRVVPRPSWVVLRGFFGIVPQKPTWGNRALFPRFSRAGKGNGARCLRCLRSIGVTLFLGRIPVLVNTDASAKRFFFGGRAGEN
jgi:hypothetical protein